MTFIIPLLLLLSASAWAAPPAVSTTTAPSPATVQEPFVLEAARRHVEQPVQLEG